ncbi:MAG: type I 3-dehydroquinate dehydratase [Gemmataceae bacterium]
MICISIAQESRRFALADMVNSGRVGDLLELRLDRFAKAADIGELLAAKPKPVIISCRRPRDGGHWDGTEEERQALLRQAIVSKADYVEIELDIADQIRPFPPAKRIVSYTNLAETPANIGEIYDLALTKKPDVVKLTTVANTMEEAWPLVQILVRREVPTVVVGLGKPGVMLSVLSAKLGAPWTYAALERGMEAYPDQATVTDLKEVYHYPSIGGSTPLVGVAGFSERDRATVAGLNAAFAEAGMAVRCLPLGVGSMKVLGKVVKAAKLVGAAFGAEHRPALPEIAGELDLLPSQVLFADLLLRKDKQWRTADSLAEALPAALEAAIKRRNPAGTLAGQIALIVGANNTAHAIGRELAKRGCSLIIASHNQSAATSLASLLQCRGVQFEALYTVLHQILIVCDEAPSRTAATGRSQAVHPGYLRPGMVVAHLTPGLHKSTLIRAAEARSCEVVTSYGLWLEQVRAQARHLTGQDRPPAFFAAAAPWLEEEE